MVVMYQQALEAGGYRAEPTEENVREMFLDYVDSGFFSNVDPEEVDEIPTEEMCNWFIRNR